MARKMDRRTKDLKLAILSQLPHHADTKYDDVKHLFPKDATRRSQLISSMEKDETIAVTRNADGFIRYVRRTDLGYIVSQLHDENISARDHVEQTMAKLLETDGTTYTPSYVMQQLRPCLELIRAYWRHDQ